MGNYGSTPQEEEAAGADDGVDGDVVEEDFGGYRDGSVTASTSPTAIARDGSSPELATLARTSTWSGAFGELESDQVLDVNKVDAMQIMWQRALQAKTTALDRLRDELEVGRVGGRGGGRKGGFVCITIHSFIHRWVHLSAL